MTLILVPRPRTKRTPGDSPAGESQASTEPAAVAAPESDPAPSSDG